MNKIGKPLPALKVLRKWKGKKYPEIGRKYREWIRPISDIDRLEKFAEHSNQEYTLPEKIIQVWLEARNYIYEPQVPIPGAGARVDFLIYLGVPGVVIRVQGTYWHTLGNRAATDLIQYLKLKSKGYGIFDAWEEDIYAHTLNGSLFEWCDRQVVIAT